MDAARNLGVYVHWPYCEAICPYCDFNVRVARYVDEAAWRRAFDARIDAWAPYVPGRTIGSVFFGGGTPSLMSPALVGHVLDRLHAVIGIANGAEVSLEANPTSTEMMRFRGFVSAGVNRLSIGVQALNDADLKRLGRRHDRAEALEAIRVARAVCDRVSFDMIHSRPDQSVAAWRAELTDALALGPDHLSAYELTIERGTAFARQQTHGRLGALPDEDMAVAFAEGTAELCAAHGLQRYETSNHAVPGAESMHNMTYWRAGDWIGIGPGAHGRVWLDGRRLGTVERRDPKGWLAGAGDPSVMDVETLTHEAAAEEVLFGGLRMRDGMPLSRIEVLGYRLPDAALLELEEDGLIVRDAGRLRVTERGALLVDPIVGSLVPLQPTGRQKPA